MCKLKLVSFSGARGPDIGILVYDDSLNHQEIREAMLYAAMTWEQWGSTLIPVVYGRTPAESLQVSDELDQNLVKYLEMCQQRDAMLLTFVPFAQSVVDVLTGINRPRPIADPTTDLARNQLWWSFFCKGRFNELGNLAEHAMTAAYKIRLQKRQLNPWVTLSLGTSLSLREVMKDYNSGTRACCDIMDCPERQILSFMAYADGRPLEAVEATEAPAEESES